MSFGTKGCMYNCGDTCTGECMKPEEKETSSPYCPICNGCGEDICCPATACKQHPDGSYCGTYLKDLKFGYKMDRWVADNLYRKMPEELQAEYDLAWDRLWDETYTEK